MNRYKAELVSVHVSDGYPVPAANEQVRKLPYQALLEATTGRISTNHITNPANSINNSLVMTLPWR